MYLASRLLRNLSENNELETLFVAKFKTTDNIHWTNKLEHMIQDIEQSKEYTTDFHQTYNEFECKLDPSICGFLAWPRCSIQPVRIPPNIANISQKFAKFYEDRFDNNRSVQFQMDKGKADVSVQFNAKCKRILVVSTYQMMVLLLFNDKKTLTFKDMLDLTEIPRQDLIRAVLSMAHPKIKVMRKAPNTKYIVDNHKFQLNPKYYNPRARVPVPTLNITFEPSPPSPDIEAIYRLRRHQMDAAIVRIMKAFKTLKHPDLVTKVVKQVRGRFTPKPMDIKKRIANLIDLEYLERDKNNRSLYHYIP